MEYCSKCGNEFSGKFCPKCGNPSRQIIMEQQRKPSITGQSWFVILMLIFVFPIGLFFMWKNKKFPKAVCIIITVLWSVLVILFGIGVIVGSGEDSGDKYLSMVKGGYPEIYEDDDITYEEAFEEYFDSPEWEYFESTDDQDVVEFTGECTYDGEYATILVQFVINSDTKFTLHYMEIDGDIIDDEEMANIICTVFDSALDY